MNRRGFLGALAGTLLAPFIPAIAAAPKLDSLPFAEILRGDYPLFLAIGNEAGPIRALGRHPIQFVDGESRAIQFDEATQTCTVDRGFLENEDGSISIPFNIRFSSTANLCAGDTVNVSGITINLSP